MLKRVESEIWTERAPHAELASCRIFDMGDEDLKELMDPVNLMYFQ